MLTDPFSSRGRPITEASTGTGAGFTPGQPEQQIESALSGTVTAERSPAAAPEALIAMIGRLERLLDTETAQLSSLESVPFEEFNRKKSHALLEFHRATDGARSLDIPRACLEPALAGLRAALQKNLRLLETHLQATRAVAAIIIRAIQDCESDGTYTPSCFQKGQRS